MRKAICPITKKPMDCKACKVAKNDTCPYIEFDKVIEYTLKFVRELVENEKKQNGLD